MNAILETLHRCAQAWLPVLLDSAIKGAALLAAAGLAVALMRRTSAAARQAVWVLALAGLLALPLLAGALPSLQVLPAWAKVEIPPPQAPPEQPVAPLPAPATSSGSREAPPLPASLPPDDGLSAPLPASFSKGAAAATVEPAPAPECPAPEGSPQPTRPGALWLAVLPWAMVAWAAGAAVCLLPLMLGRLSLWRLARSSHPVSEGSWAILARRTAEGVGLRREVRLLQSNREPMPMLWGVVRPRLLIPAEAKDWSADRRWVVLLHELAHARRRDCLAKFIAHLACALYWFNPLAWLAFKRMQAEAETACDDLVLACGHGSTELPEVRPSDYATHLLEIASGLKSGMLAAYSSIAMARKSRLEGRLLAILDPRRSRRALTKWGLLAAAVFVAGLVVPIALLRATAPDKTAGKDANGAETRPPTRPADQAGEILWGSVAEGRQGTMQVAKQVGIQLVGSQRTYGLGEKVTLAFHVRNRGKQAFTAAAVDDAKGWMAMLAKPEEVTVLKQIPRDPAKPRVVTVLPGEAACVGKITFELVPWTHSGAGPLLHVRKGVNPIRFDLDISHLTGPSYYTGLSSGVLRLEVGEGGPTSRPTEDSSKALARRVGAMAEAALRQKPADANRLREVLREAIEVSATFESDKLSDRERLRDQKHVRLVRQVAGDVPPDWIDQLTAPLAERPSVRLRVDLFAVPAKLKDDRGRLLAEADARIRNGLLDLAEKFPHMKNARDWGQLSRIEKPPAGLDRLSLWLSHNSGGKAGTSDRPVPENERFSVLVSLGPPSPQITQMVRSPIYPCLGLTGQCGASAGDANVDAALKKLLADALAPLADLDQQAAKAVSAGLGVATQSSTARPSPAQTQPAKASFGPVIERVLPNDAEHHGAIGFETGAVHDWPQAWLRTSNTGRIREEEKWMKDNRIAASAGGAKGLVGHAMAVTELKAAFQDVTHQAVIDAVQGLDYQTHGLPPADGPEKFPLVMAFKTHYGGMGVLEIVGRTDNPKGVRIRYRLVRDAIIRAELDLEATGGKCYLDLDSSYTWSAPRALCDEAARIRWREDLGIDLWCDTRSVSANPVLVCLGLKAVEAKGIRLEDLTVTRAQDLLRQAEAGERFLIRPSTYVFRTREGALGVLEVIGLDGKKRPNATFRYRILPEAPAGKAATQPATQPAHAVGAGRHTEKAANPRPGDGQTVLVRG